MARLARVLSAAVIVGAGLALTPASVRAQGTASEPTVTRIARLSTSTITGVVRDERGAPVPGARVTAIGATMAMAFTDRDGRFVTETLPAGEYFVGAHRAGFSASKRTIVRVGGAPASAPPLEVRRLDATAGTTGLVEAPLDSRPIIAAGFSLPEGETAEPASGGGKEHPHSETSWRMRHIKRSILKDRSNAIVLAGNDVDFDDESIFGRGAGGAAGSATSFLSDWAVNGEVNLLTTGAMGPGELFSGDGLPRGVAYLALGAPTPAGNEQEACHFVTAPSCEEAGVLMSSRGDVERQNSPHCATRLPLDACV